MAIDFCGPPKPIESTATLIIGRQNPEAVSKAVGGCVHQVAYLLALKPE
jgi:hypothetical protein